MAVIHHTRQDRQHVVWVFRCYFTGALVTLELAISSVVLAVIIGLMALAVSSHKIGFRALFSKGTPR